MSLIDAVSALLLETAQNAILPKFGNLARSEIREKTPGDYVTDVDLAVERLLGDRLVGLLPGSKVVGEEGVAADPDGLLPLHGDDPVWIIDPIDGTGNFVSGDRRFAVLLALTRRGRTRAGWILDPLGGRLAAGEDGSGAWMAGRKLAIDPAGPLERMHGSGRKRDFDGLVGGLVHHRSAAHDYLALLENSMQFASFRPRLNPWDHAAGVLLHREAGGHSGLLDGRAYAPVLMQGVLLMAPDRNSWQSLAARMRP